MGKTAQRCDLCYQTVMFGGIKERDYIFCDRMCQRSAHNLLERNFSETYLQEQVIALHQGRCSFCHGAGPIDIQVSHRIISIILYSYFSSTPHICCRKCGRREQIKDCLVSLLLGWWGFPWGILITPVYIIMNLIGILKKIDNYQPSKELYSLMRRHYEMRIMQSHR